MERAKLNHFSHPHPLVFNDETIKKDRCSGCLESLYGPIYSCEECEFHLHKRCAEAPLQITNSPFHRECHSDLFLRKSSSKCVLCLEHRKMFAYNCSCPDLSIDIKCALRLHNIDDSFLEFKFYVHHHSLSLIQNPIDELQSVDCYLCLRPMGIQAIYACLKCRFYLHKICAQFPSQLNHPFHRKHVLYPEISYGGFCSLCQESQMGLLYRCSPCNFQIGIECIHSKSKAFRKSRHEHPITLLFRQYPFLCDACGTEGDYISYLCSVCHILVHKECISLPHKIRTSRHNHLVIHSYVFQKKESVTYECGICLDEVKTWFGSYHCFKKDCDYVAHVKCALEGGMYEEVEEDEQTSGDFLAGSCITCIIEKNDNGEAWKIKHVSHEHELILSHQVDEENVLHKQCEGCMLYISTSYYYCSDCQFFLHKTCAELPKKMYPWFSRSLTTFDSKTCFWCDKCRWPCSGFFYGHGDLHFCVRCVSISHTPKCEGHKHKLVFNFDFAGKCNGCGDAYLEGFKCKECTDFGLDWGCITLPPTIHYDCDTHLLKLAFRDHSDDPEQHYCDKCEGKRNPDHWFYYCAICDNSIHINCALGLFYPFFKQFFSF